MRAYTAILLLALASPAVAEPKNSTPLLPDAQTISRIESLAKNSKVAYGDSLPGGLRNIQTLTRFYTYTSQDGHLFVWGEIFTSGHGDLHIVHKDQMREIQDGGCGAVTLFYDVKAAKIYSLSCHGLA